MKISQLEQATQVTGSMIIPVSYNNTNKSVTTEQLKNFCKTNTLSASNVTPTTAKQFVSSAEKALIGKLDAWKGTQTEYNALTTKDENQMYVINDSLDTDKTVAVYLGTQLLWAEPNLVGEFSADSTPEDWYWFPNGVKTALPVDPFTHKFSLYFTTPLTQRFAMFWTDNEPNLGQNIASLEKIPSIANLTEIRWVLSNLKNIPFSPAISTTNATDLQYLYQGCNELKFLPALDTAKAKKWENAFNNCIKLKRIESLDFSAVETISTYTFNCPELQYLKINNLGKGPCTTYFFNLAPKWGTVNAANKASLIDTLLTNSYDRAANGKSAATIKLAATTFALLSSSEISAITAKGFTLVTA